MNEKKIAGQWLQWKNYVSRLWNFTKGGFKSEDTEEFFRCQNKYSNEALSFFSLVILLMGSICISF